ncbi:VENN motif pre-toxin domain-containing protein, partial [Gilliamella sp. B2923]|uniref:VENN motif pre-toxin domain-containing protein n=1 Tax=Gilliamella sp. B2923 TaxID=2818005 RepID=UPI00226AC4BD
EKQNISALAQLAAGLAIAAGGGDTGAAGAAIAAGKNAVENNLLSPADVAEADKKYAACNGDRKCQMQVVKETNELDKEKIRALQEYKNQLLEEYAERYREIIADCEGYTTCQLERRDWLQEEIDNRYRDFYNIVTDGASPDDLSFGYYPDDTKIQSLWEGMKNAPGKLVDNIVEGGDKAIRYIDDNSLGKIADDAWEFGKKIASIPREWLNKEIPADSFETALTNLASMTGHDVGEASFYTVAGTATAALGGKIIQWIDGKWTPVKIGSLETGKGPTANKPLDKTDLELQHGKGNVEQGGGNYKETKDKILDNHAANQKANESSKFGEHVAKEQQINAGKGATQNQPEWISDINSPNSRHYFDKIKQGTTKKDKNTVIDSSVDVNADMAAIKNGQATIKGNQITVNGRTYEREANGTLAPISGNGFTTLDRGSFDALGIYKKFGNTSKADEILNKMGLSHQSKQAALDVWKRNQK